MPASSPIAFLLFDGMEELDLVGPWEVFSVWHEHFGGSPCVSIASSTNPVTCRYGLTVTPDRSFEEAGEFGALVVPGGDGSRTAASDPATLRVVRAVAATAHAVMSVCTGARILQAAGLLEGRSMTTHHSAFDEANAWEGVELREGRRFVRDGRVWTSAGVSAGIDLALAYVKANGGEDTAEQVRRFIEWDATE